MPSYIFDFDGVIGDTFEVLSEFYAKVTFKSVEQAQLAVRNTLLENKTEDLKQKVIKTIFAKPFEKYIEKHTGSLLFEDRLEEIKKLDGLKFILTNNYSTICKKILGKNAEFFDLIIGMEEVNSKLEGLDLILERPDCEISTTKFVTDSVGDILEIQKRLPMDQIYGASWGFHSVETLLKYLPKKQILNTFENF